MSIGGSSGCVALPGSGFTRGEGGVGEYIGVCRWEH